MRNITEIIPGVIIILLITLLIVVQPLLMIKYEKSEQQQQQIIDKQEYLDDFISRHICLQRGKVYRMEGKSIDGNIEFIAGEDVIFYRIGVVE